MKPSKGLKGLRKMTVNRRSRTGVKGKSISRMRDKQLRVSTKTYNDAQRSIKGIIKANREDMTLSDVMPSGKEDVTLLKSR